MIKSICPYCGVGCGILIESNGKKVVKIKPQKDHPVSKGELCIKGVTIDKIINHKDRLKSPLVRKGSKLVEATWDEAIDFIHKKLIDVISTYGNDAIGVFASSKCTNEENFLLQKLAREVFFTKNIDNCTRLCHAPSLAGFHESVGKSAMSNTYEDLPQSDCILIIGSNPASCQPIGFRRLLECKKHGGKIITVDVRKSETAEKSDKFIRIHPGTDSVFAAGLLKIIIDDKLYDRDFIKKRTMGFEKLRKSLNMEMEEIIDATGASEKEIRYVAEKYAKGNSALIHGMGVTQQRDGMETILAIANLALATGNIGKPGTGLNPLRGCNNVQGSCDMGCLPNYLPGYKETHSGLTEVEMIEAIPEKILAMYIVGENPLMSHPNINKIKNEMKNLDLLIVQDIFMTETCEIADVVLPAACFAEKTGTFTNTERRVQKINKAAEPPGNAKTDMEIFSMIAEKFGSNFSCLPEEIFNEIRKKVSHYSGITYKMLDKKTVCWPCDKNNPDGTLYLFKQEFFQRNNKGIFYPAKRKQLVCESVYPFKLITHRSLEQYNTGTFSRKISALKRKPSMIEISRKDADSIGVKNGDSVCVKSEFGKIIAKIKISGRVPRWIVTMENHYSESKINELTSSVLDPISKIPEFKNCCVRIEKIMQ